MPKQTISPADRFGLSERHWDSLSERDQGLYEKIRPLRNAAFKVDHFLGSLETGLAAYEKDAKSRGGVFDINPDFQRGHVWDRARQISFMENAFRGTAPMTIKLNCAGWDELGSKGLGDIPGGDIVCVDGLQRLTAVRDFIAGKYTVFGDETVETLEGTSFDIRRHRLTIEMFTIKNRADLLQFYLDLNKGGVVHTEEELSRVEGMLRDLRAAASQSASAGKAEKGGKATKSEQKDLSWSAEKASGQDRAKNAGTEEAATAKKAAKPRTPRRG